jgi:hypothetical protein
MIGWPHFLHGTVASGARSPGINSFVPHQWHVTIRSGLSLMLRTIYIPAWKKAICTAQKLFDKRAEIVFLSTGYENENHVCTNAEARASQRTVVHLDACWLPFWHRGNEILI